MSLDNIFEIFLPNILSVIILYRLYEVNRIAMNITYMGIYECFRENFNNFAETFNIRQIVQ